MYGKGNMEVYITICKIDSQREFDVWLRKLKQGLCINLEEWEGNGDERELQKGEDICIPMADICIPMADYAKAFDCLDHNKLWEILKEMGIPDHLICL